MARSAARRDGADLQHPPRLEHLLAGEAVERRHEAERPGREGRRPVGDERAGAVAGLHHAHRRQRLQPGPHRRTADADLHRQLALGRQAIARAQLALLDERPHVGDDVLGRDAIGRADRRPRRGTRHRMRLASTAFVSLAIGRSWVQCTGNSRIPAMNFLGIDVGTGGTRALVIDERGPDHRVGDGRARAVRVAAARLGRTGPARLVARDRRGRARRARGAGIDGGGDRRRRASPARCTARRCSTTSDEVVRPALLWCDQRTGAECRRDHRRRSAPPG